METVNIVTALLFIVSAAWGIALLFWISCWTKNRQDNFARAVKFTMIFGSIPMGGLSIWTFILSRILFHEAYGSAELLPAEIYHLLLPAILAAITLTWAYLARTSNPRKLKGFTLGAEVEKF